VGAEPVVERTPVGAQVVVDGVVRATFVGDLDDPEDRAAFEEMVGELRLSGPQGLGSAQR
jgi:hypothetical protein